MVDLTVIQRKARCSNPKERARAANRIGRSFALLPDNDSAWQDIHRLTGDDDIYVRRAAANALGRIFGLVPDKDSVWEDLHQLASDNFSCVRREVVHALGSVFNHVLYRDLAWQDIHRLAGDDISSVRREVVHALGSVFNHVLYRDLAWQDIHRLAGDDNSSVRRAVAYTIGSAFSDVRYRDSAWEDLHRLTSDDNNYVRDVAVFALGRVFDQVPDRDLAWQDLHRLAGDDDNIVRCEAAGVLGTAFSNFPERDSAWQDLHRLVGDNDKYVRVYANHSLGRTSIFKATESDGEDDFRGELENALMYFERSASEAKYLNPSKFCLLFYRSFYFLTCKRGNPDEEVRTYLAEAKEAVKGSKSKEELLEAVENLASALSEVQNLHNLGDKKSDLKAYMQYCNRAAELLDNTEEQAPGATRLVRRGLPILGRRIKALLKEIEEESGKLRVVTRDTPFEALGERTDERTQGLARVEYRNEAERIINETVPDIRIMCHFLPERSKASVCELQDWDKLDFERKASLFKRAISHCSQRMEVLSQEIVQKDEWIGYLKDEVIGRLKNINYNIFKLKISSANAADSLRALKWELDRIRAIESDIDGLGSKVEDLDVSQQKALQELKAQMPRLIGELETIAKNRDDKLSREILTKLDGLKRSPGEAIFERAAGLASIVSLLIALV